MSDISRSSVDMGELNGTVGFVLDVKRELAAEPALYRRFVDIVRRCHDQRAGTNFDIHALHQIVLLLRTRPQLVLGLNAFLPDGYRIRMFDRSAYVIEYPDPVVGVARLTVTV